MKVLFFLVAIGQSLTNCNRKCHHIQQSDLKESCCVSYQLIVDSNKTNGTLAEKRQHAQAVRNYVKQNSEQVKAARVEARETARKFRELNKRFEALDETRVRWTVLPKMMNQH